MIRTLAVIPARSGSTGVAHKNIRAVAGKPLIVWTIAAARAAAHLDRIIVSTDSVEYARIAEKAGAEVVMRPPEASNAGSRIEEALLHVLGAVGAAGYAPDLVVTLQPTVPVRRLDLIDACVAHLALRPKLNSVVSVYRVGVVWERFKDALFPPYRWRNQYGGEIPQRQGVSLEDERFVEDGAVFVTRTAALVATNDRRSAPSEPFVGERTVDIDTEEDLLLADALLRARLGKGEAVA